MSGGAVEKVTFGPAPPKGHRISALFVLAAVFFAALAYLMNCEDLTCDAPPRGSKSLWYLGLLILVSLGLAVAVWNVQGIRANFAISEAGFRLAAEGSLYEPDQTLPFDRIAGLRHVPGYRSKGVLVFDLVPEREGAARGKYVNLPLDGLAGRSQPVFDAVRVALSGAGYRIEGGAFAPGLIGTVTWKVVRDRA